MLKRFKFTLILCTVILCAALFMPIAEAEDAQNILQGGDFEETLDYWTYYTWFDNTSEFSIDTSIFRSGRGSLLISSPTDNDARIIQELSVKRGTYYIVTAYVKTENVPSSTAEKYSLGATISIMGTTYVSRSITGNTDWTKVTFSFKTADDMDNVLLCFTLGGYSAINSGKAWFDDITVVESATRPAGAYTLESETADSGTDSGWHGGQDRNENADSIKWMPFTFVWFILIAILLIAFASTGSIHGDDKKMSKVFIIAIVIASVARIFLAMFTTPFDVDINLFKWWAWHASSDLFNMYSGALSFIDYPPLYMYVLAPIGGIVNALYEVGAVAFGMLLIKLPSMIADIVTSVILYKFTKKYIDSKWAVVIGLFYAFNPAVWINSAGWAQVDSFFTMLVVIDIVFIVNKKWVGSGIFFALMVLMKPHGIILAPALGCVLLVEIIRNKKWKPIVFAMGSGILTFVVVLLPFYIRTGFQNPTWIIELYAGTLGQYEYATMNAFNLYAFLNKNVASVNELMGGLTFAQWGTIGIGISIFLAILFSYLGSSKRIKAREAMPIIVSVLLVVSVFTLVHKMHERYMFASMALALMAFARSRDKSFLWLAVIFSFLVFFNTYMIYNFEVMYSYPYPDSGDKAVIILGGIEVLSFILLLIASVKVLIANKISLPGSIDPLRAENDIINVKTKADDEAKPEERPIIQDSEKGVDD